MASATKSEVATEPEALYVYGIVLAGAVVDHLTGDGMGGEVRLVVDGPVGAVVESVDADRPIGRRRELVAHSRVLNTLALRGPVLPMRFGSVVQDKRAVIEELLGPQQEHFARLLAEVTGKMQFALRARYVLDAVLADVVAQDPRVAELRRRTAGLPEEATYYDRIRLGELVAHAVDVRRDRDTQLLVDRLAPHAEDYAVRDAAGMDDLAEVSFLVADEARDDFEQVAEELAEELHDRATLSLVGPTALFDFIPEQ